MLKESFRTWYREEIEGVRGETYLKADIPCLRELRGLLMGREKG